MKAISVQHQVVLAIALTVYPIDPAKLIGRRRAAWPSPLSGSPSRLEYGSTGQGGLTTNSAAIRPSS